MIVFKLFISLHAQLRFIVKQMTHQKLRQYDISFVGLKHGKHLFEYEIGNAFFELFDYHEFNNSNQKVSVVLDKKSNLLELFFKSEGFVNVNCDVTNEPFDLSVNGELHLIVKFGNEYNDENDEFLVIPAGEHTINIAQYIYEMIVLSVPSKRVHPDVEEGVLHSEILDILEQLSPKESQISENPSEIDPRWNELKKLLNNK